jgi:hypothetical protein
VELRAARSAAPAGGWNPITYEAIEAWARLTGIEPTRREVQLLRLMDLAASKVAASTAAPHG